MGEVDGAMGYLTEHAWMRSMCMAGRTPGNVDVDKRLTLIGDGADAMTMRAKDFNNRKEIDK